MKQIVKLTIWTISLLFVGTAMAASTGWNVGASVGSSSINLSDADCAGTTKCDKSDTGFKVSGGYTFMPNFGVELAYIDLGKATLSDGTITASLSETGLAAYGVGTYPIDNFSLFAKAGISSLKSKIDAAIGGFSASDSSTNTNFAWGIGAGYTISKNVSAMLEWERYKGDFSDISSDLTYDVDLISIGMKYNF